VSPPGKPPLQFAAELPAFVHKIRRIFTSEEIRTYPDQLERTKFRAPLDPLPESKILTTKSKTNSGLRTL
jgi:hypothetical protein